MTKQIGELHDNNTIFLHVFVGTAKDDDQEYELTYGRMHTPIVRNLKSGKYFTLSWNDVLQLAREAGIDEMVEPTEKLDQQTLLHVTDEVKAKIIDEYSNEVIQFVTESYAEIQGVIDGLEAFRTCKLQTLTRTKHSPQRRVK